MAEKPRSNMIQPTITSHLKAAGLYTNYNFLSEVPDGGASTCLNIWINRKGISESRRGFKQFGEVFDAPAPYDVVYQYFPYQGTRVVWANGPALTGNGLFYYDSKAFATATVTVVDYTQLSGVVLTIGAFPLTEGVDWTAATSNTDTANSICGAIVALEFDPDITFSAPVLVADNIVPLTALEVGTAGNSIVLTSSDPTNLTVTGGGTFTGGIDPGTWSALSGTVPNTDNAEEAFKTTESNKNLYFSSTQGVIKLDNAAGPILRTGGLPGLNGSGATDTTGSGWMTDDTAVAYRITWSHTDANNNEITGTPSERLIITNTSGNPQIVNLEWTIPAEATTDSVYKIYRSVMSASAATEPDDELQLVLFGSPSALEIAQRYFQIDDAVPESLRQGDLYTNSGEQGIAQANNIPPSCWDIQFFQGYTLFANCTTQQSFKLTMLSVDAPSGIQIDDTFSITQGSTSFTITGKAAEDAANDEFLVETGGTPAENIETTSKSIVNVLNRSASNTICYAFYTSGSGDPPGRILIQERYIGQAEFSLTSSRDTWSDPALPSSSGPVSIAENLQNGIYFSKYNQPEHVPLANNFTIGSANFPIYRIQTLRTSVIVWKLDGVFRILAGTSSSSPFQVLPVDLTVFIESMGSAVKVNNLAWAATNKGIVNVSDTGSPQIVSLPIDNIIQRKRIDKSTWGLTWGFAYESENTYGLATYSGDWDIPDDMWVYNIINNTWGYLKLPIPVWDVQVDPADDRWYLASGDADFPYVFQERKAKNSSDYADQEFAITIVSFDSTPDVNGNYTVEIDDSSEAVAGYALAQYDPDVDIPTILFRANIVSITDSTHIVVDRLNNWDLTLGDAVIAVPINRQLQLIPFQGGTSAINKRFIDYIAYFQEPNFETCTIVFSSSVTGASTPPAVSSVLPRNFGGWGTLPWTVLGWGTQVFPSQPTRGNVPRNACRGLWLTPEFRQNEAFTNFMYLGISLTYYNCSVRGWK
jgi:hypothetical protein